MEVLSHLLENNTNLRINCSDLGAVIGFHPYVDLVDLFFKYLYQDLMLLLEIDETTLGVTLLSREDEVDEIIHKIDPQRQALLHDILRNSENKSLLQTATQANHFLQRLEGLLVNEEVMKVVSKEEVETVVQEVSGRVRKRYGSHCEEEAVKRYEEATGFEVIERNTQTYYYDLMRQEEEEEQQQEGVGGSAPQLGGGKEPLVEVVDLTEEESKECDALTKSYPTINTTSSSSSATSDVTTTTTSTSLSTPSMLPPQQPLYNNNEVEKTEIVTRKIDQWVVRTENTSTSLVNEKEVEEVEVVADGVVGRTRRRASTSATTTATTLSSKKRPSGQLAASSDNGSRPSTSSSSLNKSKLGKTTSRPEGSSTSSSSSSSTFVLVGRIDGLSYQLDMSSENALQWKECKVIVEMKTRVRQIHRPPPLYEQLQVVAYMKMLHCVYGDLVQYIPTTSDTTSTTTSTSNTTTTSTSNTNTSTRGRSVSASTVSANGSSGSSSATSSSACVVREGSTSSSSEMMMMIDDHKTLDLFPAFSSLSNNHNHTSQLPLPQQQQQQVEEQQEVEEEKGSSGSGIEELYIHRVSLHGPPYHHSLHWQSVVLPRLHVFRDSIITMRRDRDLRYTFLLANQQERRALIAYLCPYFP